MLMHRLHFVLFAACLPCLSSFAIPEAPRWPHGIEMAGWHAEAVAVALQEFRKHQGTKTDAGEPVYGNLRHYTVVLRRIPEGVEVYFEPESGPKDMKEHTLGGRGQYGIEVSYEVRKRDLKIIKTNFAR
jgi:hypothetical protein